MLVRIALVATLFVSLALVPAGAAPAPVAAQAGELSTPELLNRAVARGRLRRATADRFLAFAFTDHTRVPDRFVSDVPWDGTLPLLDLRQRVARMRQGAARAGIEAALASNPGTCAGESGGPSSSSSAHFFVEYVNIQSGLSIGDYTTSLEAAWSVEVTSFGWAAPPLHPSTPGGKYHVVIDILSPGLYGFVTTSGTFAGLAGDNPNTGWTEPDAYRTCMVLNRDYGPFPGTPQQALDATTAHEFNHSIQFGYGAITGSNAPDDVFIEGGATWMEDEVFDGANDNYNYLWPDFDTSMGDYGLSPYPYWAVFRALTERFGTGTTGAGEEVMQDFWEAVSQSSSSVDLNALNAGLANKGTTLAAAYHDAAVALKFNVACTGGVAYPDCLEEGPSYVAAAGATPVHATIASIGGGVTRSLEDNYALNWIQLPGTGPYGVTLQNNSSNGGQFRATVACPTGSGMTKSALPSVVGPSSAATLASFDPSGCAGPPVAVVTNQSHTAANPTNSVARSYTLSTASPGPSHDLTVVVTGQGTVTGTGIACPGDCFQNYPEGTAVSLVASESPGWEFDGWSGDCTGTGTCDLTMDGDHSVTATFTPLPTFPLDVFISGSGSGTVSSSPAGIACPTDCSEAYPSDASVTLTATAALGSIFGGWGGDCPSTTGACTVTTDQARTVTATFIGRKSVSLTARPKRVEAGERTRLTATVSPCQGHEGDLVQFSRRSKRIATKPSNAACVARLRVAVQRTTVFRAVSPQQDADHLAGTSKKVRVRVPPA